MTYTDAEKGEIRSDIELLYRAGRIDFPDRADAVAQTVSRMNALVDELNGRAAQLGDPKITQDVLATCVEVHNALVQTAATLNDCAVGLVYIADDFVARDEYAREVFNSLSRGITQGPVGQATVPSEINEDGVLAEGDGDEYTSSPEVQDPDAELGDRDDQFGDDQQDLPEPDVDIAGD